MRVQMRKPIPSPINPSGLCHCGCGQPTPLATKTRRDRGSVAGEPTLFLSGHGIKGKRAEQSHRWKGGRWQHKGGYIYRYAPKHPAANADGYVYEHRLVAEATIGRYLKRREVVHHKNGNKIDNRPENLEVLNSQQAHGLLHRGEALRRYAATPAGKAARIKAGAKGAAIRWGKPVTP